MPDVGQNGSPIEPTVRFIEPATAQIAEQSSGPSEQTAQLIPLEAVRPDPEQPRRLLPGDLAEALASGSPPQEILTLLRARAERDKWARERLRELEALAQSIGEDGLLQPIRVLPDGEGRYLIEEGERRWWAHHILLQQGREEFRLIKAFAVEHETAEAGVLRRRVAENMLRSGFTAIELARAMANRIQEILAAEPSTKRGDAERRVGTENGMSDRRVRQFVALLTLSPEAQDLAQQARLTENSLRWVVGIQDAAKQVAAIRELMHLHPDKPTLRGNSKPAKREGNTRNQIHKVRAGRRQARANRKSAPPNRQSDRQLRRQTTTAVNVKRSRLPELLRLAKLLTEPGLRLDRSDWKRMMKTGANRAALVKLQTILQQGLAVIPELDERRSQP